MVKLRDRYEHSKELHLEKLKPKFFSLCKKFQTHNRELREFLIEDAYNGQKMCVNCTYLVFDAKDFKKNNRQPADLQLLAYVTLSNDSISLDPTLKDKFRTKGVNYKSLPAMKICRLCVDERHERKGIGNLILLFCIKRAVFSNNNCACRFVTLDAKRHKDREKDSLSFYKKYGFQVLQPKSRNLQETYRQTSGATAMYLDIYHLVRETKVDRET